MSYELISFPEVIEFLEGPGVRNWQFKDSGIKLINIRNLVNDGLELSNTNNYLDKKEVAEKYNHFLLNAGDYVMASSGVTWGKIAEVKEEHLPLCLNTSIIKLLPKDKRVEKKFLWHFIKSNHFTSQIDKLITGSAQPNFGPSHLKQIKFPLPPLSTQKKIAEILDTADSLRQKDKALIEKYNQLTQSLFLEMFGDSVKNEKGWEKKVLSSLINSARGISYGIVQRGEDLSSGIPVVRIRDIVEGNFKIENLVLTKKEISDKYKRTILEGGEILISIRGTVGKIAIAPIHLKGANISREVAIIPLEKEYNIVYFKHLLQSKPIQNSILSDVKGIAQSGINLNDLKNYELIYPPIKVQNEFSSIIEEIEKQKQLAEASLEKSEALFQSLLQKAFKGELAK